MRSSASAILSITSGSFILIPPVLSLLGGRHNRHMDRFRGRKYNPLGNILRNKRRVLHIQSSAITLELLAALAHVHKLSL